VKPVSDWFGLGVVFSPEMDWLVWRSKGALPDKLRRKLQYLSGFLVSTVLVANFHSFLIGLSDGVATVYGHNYGLFIGAHYSIKGHRFQINLITVNTEHPKPKMPDETVSLANQSVGPHPGAAVIFYKLTFFKLTFIKLTFINV
jgi:hypothetical protein